MSTPTTTTTFRCTASCIPSDSPIPAFCTDDEEHPIDGMHHTADRSWLGTAPTSPVTDENVEDMIGAAESGITYWAHRPSQRSIKAHPEAICHLADDDGTYHLTADAIRRAYFELLLDFNQQLVNCTIHGYFLHSWADRTRDGIDAGHIDADAGDVLLQVAAFSKVIYG